MEPGPASRRRSPRQETPMPRLFHSHCSRLRPLAVALVAAGAALSQRAVGQGAASTPASVSQLTCAQANALLAAQATGHSPDAPFLRPQSRSDADAALRILTYSAIGSPKCPADFGV